jgi:hypothetical protein
MLKGKVLAAAGAAVLIGVVAAAAFLLSGPGGGRAGAAGKHFRDVAEEAGITWQMRFLTTEQAETFKINVYDHGTGVAVADFDGDGRLEIVVNNFNDRPYLFKNDSPRRNCVAFRLTGTRSNRDAVGAVVRAYAGGQVLTRQVEPAGGYLAQSSRTVHFGLGDRALDRVEVRWPSGTVQVLERPAINTLHRVTESPR